MRPLVWLAAESAIGGSSRNTCSEDGGAGADNSDPDVALDLMVERLARLTWPIRSCASTVIRQVADDNDMHDQARSMARAAVDLGIAVP